VRLKSENILRALETTLNTWVVKDATQTVEYLSETHNRNRADCIESLALGSNDAMYGWYYQAQGFGIPKPTGQPDTGSLATHLAASRSHVLTIH